MKNLKSTKSRVILSLALLIVLTGLIPTLGIFSGGKQSAHASTGWQLQELWHNSINIPTGSYSYPGVSDIIYSSGKVYETFGFHDLYYGGDTSITDGFDSSTGSQVWQKRAGVANSTPLIANGKIYFANQSQQLHVYDATDDQLPELWNGNSTTATLDNGILYSHSGNAWVQQPAGYYSYDASTGQTNWQQTDTTCDLYPKIEIYNSIVYYIGCEINPNLYSSIYYTIEARNATDGTILWSITPQYVNTDSTGYPISPAPSYNSTLISNGHIFIAATNNIISYNATDGTQTWEKTLSDTPLPAGTRASIGQIIASGSTVYVLVNIAQTGNSSVISAEDVYALDAATGNEIWHNSTSTNASLTNASDLPYGTLVNGVLYFNYNSAIYAWDAATGNQLMMDDSVATSPTNPSISTPLIVGNVMYITRGDTNTGLYTIYAYKILRQQPSIKLSQTYGEPGSVVSVTGSGWIPSDVVDIFFSPLTSSSTPLVKATVTSSGTFQTSFTVPSHATLDSPHSVLAEDETTLAGATAPFVVTCASIGTVNPTCYSKSYAGYVAMSMPVLTRGTISVTYSDVIGSWQVPLLVCPQNKFSYENSFAAFWVGLGGLNASLEQIGISARCSYPSYLAPGVTYTPVWEMVGSPGTGTYSAQTITQGCSDSSFTTCIVVNNVKVAAGDTIVAEVKYQSTAKNYLLTIRDKTQKWHTGGNGTPLPPQSDQSVPGANTTAARGSADCITENPSVTGILITGLADFGSVFFTNCVADGKAIGNIGPDTAMFVMAKDIDGTIMAQASGLNNARKAFSVTWFNSGS